MIDAIRQYSLPVVLALGLHAAAVWALYQGWHPQQELTNIIQPRTVLANLVVVQPEAKPVPVVQPKPKPRQAATDDGSASDAKRRAEALDREAKAREAEKRAAEKKAAEDKAAQEKQAQELARQERLRRLSELAQASLDEAIAAESEQLNAGTEEMVVRSYHAGIYDLVRRNWSRPPSSRTGMSARLQVELIPTGEVISVTVVDSSGSGVIMLSPLECTAV